MAAPITYYRDPAEHLAKLHEAERSCRVCVYNARAQRTCLHPRARAHYPDRGADCHGFKHKEH